MTRTRTVAAFLVATTILGGAAYAEEAAKPPAAPPIPAAQQAADRDVARLSKDGTQAFRDLHLARIAIFDADPARAKDLVGKAQAALAKARTDEAVYMKAEADLRAPAKPGDAAGHAAAAKVAPATNAAKPADASKPAEPGKPSTQPTAWLPVDGQLTLGEDFVATPTKAAAVATANKSLEKGDRKAALDQLKLADVDVNVVLAVVPLNQTTTDVDQAASLIAQGKYYEGNALLKRVEDGVRFDVVDLVGTPGKAAPATAGVTGTLHK